MQELETPLRTSDPVIPPAAVSEETATTQIVLAFEDNKLASVLFGQYGQERQNQLGVMNAAPGLANEDYTDINALAGIGGAQQAQAQAERSAEVERHNFEQQLPANKLAQFMQMIQGSYGGTGTTTTTGPIPGMNPLLLAGAGLLGGAQAASSLGAKPFSPTQGIGK